MGKEPLTIPESLILKLLDDAGWPYKKIGTNYMGACPFCYRRNRTPNTVFNTDTNSFKCFSCGESGNLKKLADALNVNFKEFLEKEGIIRKEKQIINTKETKITTKDLDKFTIPITSEEITNYLKERNIDITVAQKYTKEIKPVEEIDKKFNIIKYYKEKEYKIAIPFFDKKNNLTCLKLRRVKNIDDNYPKSIIVKGFKKSILGLNEINQNHKFCIITEGEIDYLTLKTVKQKYKEMEDYKL